MIWPPDFQGWVDSLCLLIVVVACIAQYAVNLDRHSPTCALIGYVLAGAGAFGSALYICWPTIDSLPYDTVMHVGMAFIAVSLIREKMRAGLSLAREHVAAAWCRWWHVPGDRRRARERIDHTERRRIYEDHN